MQKEKYLKHALTYRLKVQIDIFSSKENFVYIYTHTVFSIIIFFSKMIMLVFDLLTMLMVTI